jgi:arsenite methyltransferase
MRRRREQMHRLLTAFFAATLGRACSSASTRAEDHGVVGKHHGFADANAWTNVFDDPARDAWQRPNDVMRALELAPTMIVADVGAGTGYFAVRLARAVPAGEVVATDVEPDMVRFLNERARREQLPNLRAILATRTASGLAARSVDRILVVHVWHHLDGRVEYARHLASALRPGGKLFVVDFSPAARRGPPASMRVLPELLVAELEAAGLTAKVSPVALPDQYIVEARD